MPDTAFSSAVKLARAIKKREISAVELLDHYSKRVDAHNPALNAMPVDDRDRARERAREADAALARGEDWGPLHGVPMTVKESYNVAGLKTTWGIPQFRDNVADSDALAVQRLKNAGVVIFGKTNVPLRLADFQSYNEIYGTTKNPWDLARTPGGSSGGSAAMLAAGLTGLEAGSDIGGSIRNPAHYCGVFGHKPTWNLVPARGHSLAGILSGPDIAVVGPLGRSAADLKLSLELTAGPDEIHARGYKLALEKPKQRGLRDFRVAVWNDDPIAPVSREVRARVDAVADAFRQDGANTVDHAARPELTSQHSHYTYQNLLQATLASRITEQEFEALKAAAERFDPNDQRPGVQTVRSQIMSFRDWNTHNEERTRLRWAWHRFFEKFDVLITPIMATGAFLHDHRPFGERTLRVDDAERPYFEQVFWAGLAGVACLPATVIPAGATSSGLPIGVQIIGPEFGDLTTIRAAELLERAGFKFVAPKGY
jgi:amidase